MSESEAPEKPKRPRRKSEAAAAPTESKPPRKPRPPKPETAEAPARPARGASGRRAARAPAFRKTPRPPLPKLLEIAEALSEEGLRHSRVKPPPLRRYALQEAIEAFLSDVLELLTPRRVKDWRRKLATRWRRERDQFRNKTLATQKLYGSRFRAPLRKALEEAGVPPPIVESVFEVVRIEPEIMAAVNESYRASVDDSNRHLSRVTGWREILAELTRMLDSEDPRFLALGLMGATGRRFVEVLKFGGFAPIFSTTRSGVRITQKWLIEFSGQAKTRGAENSMFGKAYPIPILAPATQVLDAFRRLRASREGERWAAMTPQQLNSSTNPPFNKLLREYAPIARHWPVEPALTLKSLRAFYAEAAMEAFAPPMTKGPYFAHILGHSETQYETALSYMTLSLNERGASAGMDEVHRLLMAREEDRRIREAQEAAETVPPPQEPAAAPAPRKPRAPRKRAPKPA